jgi:hypothetical protein
MIKEPTVFILGAGASCPYGLPLANELRRQISFEFASHYGRLLESREKESWKREEMSQRVQEFTNAFFQSSDRSIDVWLVKNPSFMGIGKQGIVSMILNGEHKGGFREKAPHPDQDWYSYLWQRMTDDFVCPEDYNKFSQNEVDFITFNYDRSLDQFLFESLTNAFYDASHSTSAKEIMEQLTKRKPIHVYGQLAPLDWQGLPSLPYGKDPDSVWTGKFTSNLKVIYEAQDTAEVQEAHKLIEKAKRIFFLGFGYAKENLDVLRVPELLRDEHEIYGTALGFTSREIEKVQRTFLERVRAKGITGTTRRDIRIENSDCLTLLRKYL